MRRRVWGIVALAALLAPASAAGHAERPSFFPEPSGRTVPKYRPPSLGGLIVCASDSRARIRTGLADHRRGRRHNRKLLNRCRFHSIQDAVNAARNGDRIQILPGTYTEPKSRPVPYPDPRCADKLVDEAGPRRPDQTVRKAPSYEYHLCSPNSANLIAILGDSDDADRRCDHKCDLYISGTGDSPDDVLIEGDKVHQNVIKADRADGIYLRNFTVQYSDFNNVYVHETDGFRFSKIVSRWSREYGFLTFTSDHGIYEDIDSYGAGDSGIYPGSGPQTTGGRYGIVVRRTKLHDNLQGTASAAGDNVLWRDNDIFDNGAGFVTDSFSPGHPGMPQHHAKWVGNRIHSNNRDDFYSDERTAYCAKPPAERDIKVVCPAIQIPTGTGVLIAGGNDNLIENNQIYDNWRYGVMQFWVEAALRAEYDPAKQQDTSHGNVTRDNRFGLTPDGRSAPTGADVFWDEQGARNCWQGNVAGEGGPIHSDPMSLPACPGSETTLPVNPAKHARLLPCGTWDAQDNPDPPGCDWFTTPPKPGSAGARRAVAPARIARAASTPAALAGPLRWVAPPSRLTQPSLPRDRIVTGMVVNDGLQPLQLRATDLRVVAGDRRARTAVSFASSYAPVIHLWNRALRPPDYDLARVGHLVELAPGERAPLTVSWTGAGDRLEYGLGVLALP
jgi:hypothetical protein